MFKFKIDKDAIELLCKVMKQNGLSEIEVKSGSQSIKLSKNISQNTVVSNVKENQIDKKGETIKDTNTLVGNLENTVKAPMLGTLYHSPSPNSKPFIKVGSKVKAGDVIFIIEAMKTMNQVKSDKTGTIKKILVENAMPVEFDQDLIIVE
jgi:acetyl-CoA carboxylase biotin carboxyl carrier protein